MQVDEQAAVDLANRFQDVVRRLPLDTHPSTVMLAMCAMLGRAIRLIEPQHREQALQWATSLIRADAEIELPN